MTWLPRCLISDHLSTVTFPFLSLPQLLPQLIWASIGDISDWDSVYISSTLKWIWQNRKPWVSWGLEVSGLQRLEETAAFSSQGSTKSYVCSSTLENNRKDSANSILIFRFLGTKADMYVSLPCLWDHPQCIKCLSVKWLSLLHTCQLERLEVVGKYPSSLIPQWDKWGVFCFVSWSSTLFAKWDCISVAQRGNWAHKLIFTGCLVLLDSVPKYLNLNPNVRGLIQT